MFLMFFLLFFWQANHHTLNRKHGWYFIIFALIFVLLACFYMHDKIEYHLLYHVFTLECEKYMFNLINMAINFELFKLWIINDFLTTLIMETCHMVKVRSITKINKKLCSMNVMHEMFKLLDLRYGYKNTLIRNICGHLGDSSKNNELVS